MKHHKRRIGDIAIEVIKEENSGGIIGYNEFGMLSEVFDRAKKEGLIKDSGSRGGILNPHPLNEHQQIRDALARDERFRVFKILCFTGRREQLVREFELKDYNG